MSALLKALPYLLAAAAALAWTALAYYLGGESRGDAVLLAWQTERAGNARAVLNALERTLDAERGLGETLAAHDARHQKELERVRTEKKLLEHLLGTGAVRVSVPARPAACCAVVASGSVPSCDPKEARAELDPSFAGALAGITSDGDSAIVDLNVCIDRYNAVRDAAATLSHAQAR
ncbi:lysis system i-spanin subunit Rz [Variovorax sp. OV700]|uniref:lysis system i-spanin subunit Rz n=1 Tax=Variovorax sp. OV700 TaxID=1882826 RepID=UPI0008881CFD|nr:lysis system i-spanin subunit Rz [Variovorax sp. OV700]SDI78324.1 Bacteriophage Rz lysis protein [Variovorax sp. OV700]